MLKHPRTPLRIEQHHLPERDFSGAGVCWRARDPGQTVDTVIIHSCYVEERVRNPPGLTTGWGYTREHATALRATWQDKLKAAASMPAGEQKDRTLTEAAESEFQAIHTLAGSNGKAAGISQDPFCPETMATIFYFYGVSAHYLITREGAVRELVQPDHTAFHAGVSKMPRPEDGREKVNLFSIGIELLASLDSGFTDAQYLSLSGLIADLRARYPLRNFYGHSDVAPGRKTDPWGFDWSRFKTLISFNPELDHGPQ